MKHSIGYLGHYDRNLEHLRPGTRTYVRDDGTIGRVVARPPDVDGVFFGYMELQGKKYVAVRAQYGDNDVTVTNVVRLDEARHTDGKGFILTNPSRFGDESARRLLSDMIAKNPERALEIQKILSELRPN
jgi:hypothetical protein